MTAKKPNIPPRSTDLAKITKSQDRNPNTSPQRIAVEEFLLKATEPMRSMDIAKRLGMDSERVRKVMWRMYADGMAVNVGTDKAAKWQSSSGQVRKTPRIDPKSYHCGGTMGYAKPGDIPRMECVR